MQMSRCAITVDDGGCREKMQDVTWRHYERSKCQPNLIPPLYRGICRSVVAVAVAAAAAAAVATAVCRLITSRPFALRSARLNLRPAGVGRRAHAEN